MRGLYCDMEMASYDSRLRNVFPDTKVALHNIVSICAFDSLTEIYHVFVYREDFTLTQRTEERVLTDGRTYTIKFYFSGYEEDVLMGFAKLWHTIDADFNKGWNNSKFDIPYYLKRCEKLGILNKVSRLLTPTRYIEMKYRDISIPGCEIFDLLPGAKKILGKYVDGTLDAMSKKILKIGKLGDTVSAVRAWQHDIDRLIDYNIRDVELTVRLDKEMPIYDYFREQMAMTGASFKDILMANYKVVQMYIMFAKHEHPFLDSFVTPTADYEKERMGGAMTLVPKVGIWDWIAVQDLSRMYPSIMLACNMSPETVVKKVRCSDEEFAEMPENIRKYFHSETEWQAMDPLEVDGVFFRQDFVGFIPRLIRIQLALRKDIERQIKEYIDEYGNGYESTEKYATFMQKRTNVKNLINSWFGVFGYEKFYLYDNDIAKSVTWLGQRQLEWSRDFVKENYGIDCLYGDTDSIFLFTPPEIVEQGIEAIVNFQTKIGEEITASYDEFSAQYGIRVHDFSMQFEKLYRRLFFAKLKKGDRAAKKRYTGHIVYKDGEVVDKTDIMGFPVRRSDAAPVTATCQKIVFDALLNSDTPEDDAYSIIRRHYVKVMDGDLDPNDVAIPQGFGSSLRRYKRKNRTYRWYAAQWSNDNLGTNFDKGSKMKVIPMNYIPAPYNQLKSYPQNEENYVGFDSDHPLREEFIPCINWKLTADKAIYEPMVSIAESLQIDINSIKTGLKQLSVTEGL